MKLRLISVFLIGLLLTGCGNVTSDKDMSEPTTQTQNTEVDSDKDITDEEVSYNENSSSEADTGKEPYIVEFNAKTVDGEELTSKSFAQSKITMLNVWATYCNPCLSEMPDLGEIASAYDLSEFQIIGIVSDVTENDGEESVEYVKELIKETKADYQHVLLNESLYTSLVGAVDSVPTTFFVNQNGELLGYILGAQPKENWEEIIDELLAKAE